MDTKPIAKVTLDGQLDIPQEILKQLQPLTEYEIAITENEIKFTKNKPKITLAEIRRRVQEADQDPNQPTLHEISQIVREVREELWTSP